MAGSGVGGSGSQEEEGQTGLALCVEPAQVGYQDEVRCRRPPSIALRSSVHMRTNVQTRPVCSVSERQAPASTTALGWGTIPYELSKSFTGGAAAGRRGYKGFLAEPAAQSSSALCCTVSCQHRPRLCCCAAGHNRGGAACRAAAAEELRGAGGCVARVFWSGGGPLGRPRQRSHTRMRSLGSRYQNRPDF